MKKILLVLCFVIASITIFSQPYGLEGLIVEKVNASAAVSGATAYRVFIDMAPGWEMQAVYGDPQNELFFQTSTVFYNNADGTSSGRALPNFVFGNPAGIFDSYVTIDGVTTTRVGILTLEDTDGTSDGFSLGTSLPLQTVGADFDVPFGNANWGTKFTTSNGAYNVNGGEQGLKATNRVLIGQFTTTGDFSFEINIQMRNQTLGLVEKYISKAPAGMNENIDSRLIYAATALPGVSISSPSSGVSLPAGTPVTISATATDADGIEKVEFYWKGVKIGQDADAAGGYTMSWTPAGGASAGAGTLSALAIDNNGDIAWVSQSNTVTDVIPSVVISAPTPSQDIKTNTAINIVATITDNGSISSVEFKDGAVLIGNGTHVGDVYTQPYIAPSSPGAHILRVEAYDNDNNLGFAEVSIDVVNPQPPIVSISDPSPGETVTMGASVAITATANDPDGGTIDSVAIYAGTTRLGAATATPYTINHTFSTSGYVNLTARAYDSDHLNAISDAVQIFVQDPSAAYLIGSSTNLCSSSDVFCVPVIATSTVTNALGFDMVMKYDSSIVLPTGVVYVRENLIVNEDWTSTSVNITDADSMFISVYLNTNAPIGTKFNGSGELICVEFAKTAKFQAVDTAEFSIDNVFESYTTQVIPKQVTSGEYITYVDNTFNGSLRFWKNNSPIAFDGGATPVYSPTDIFGSTNCQDKNGPVVRPDLSGNFEYNISGGNRIKIERDIAAGLDVQGVLTGMDQLLVAKVLVNDDSFKPNVFQMLAMDANRDGKVSAGDLSQISLRTVLHLPEFQQVWNYNDDGSKKNSALSEDWLFVPSQTLLLDKNYRRSLNYPLSDADGGFYKNDVPVADTCFQLDIEAGTCVVINGETYQGIMMGDVDGSWASLAVSSPLKSSKEVENAVIFDFASARLNGDYAEVPVSVSSDEDVNALDFSLKFNEDELAYSSIMKFAGNIEATDYYNPEDKTLRFTSYSLKKYAVNSNLVSVRFRMNSNELKSTSVNSVNAFVNGKPAVVKFIDGSMNVPNVNLYPNPANSVIFVEVSADARVIMMDLNGRSILFEDNLVANQKKEINVAGLANGVYLLKVYNNDQFVTIKKVIINK